MWIAPYVCCSGNPYFWLMDDNRQGLLPAGRVNVQYSSNFTGSVLLPETTAPV